LKALGGTAYLARLTADGQGLVAPRVLAEQIYELAMLRELVRVGRELVDNAIDTSQEIEPLAQIERAEAALYQVAEGAGSVNEAQSFSQATRTAIFSIEKAFFRVAMSRARPPA
jgi:replicative DNA helicase